LEAIDEMSEGAPAPVEELPDEPEEPEEPEPKGELSLPDEPDPKGELPLPDPLLALGVDVALEVLDAGHTTRPRPAPATTAKATTTVAAAISGDLRRFWGVAACGWGPA
jgi:hypothetical protein